MSRKPGAVSTRCGRLRNASATASRMPFRTTNRLIATNVPWSAEGGRVELTGSILAAGRRSRGTNRPPQFGSLRTTVGAKLLDRRTHDVTRDLDIDAAACAFAEGLLHRAIFARMECENRDAAARRETTRQRTQHRVERAELVIDRNPQCLERAPHRQLDLGARQIGSQRIQPHPHSPLESVRRLDAAPCN